MAIQAGQPDAHRGLVENGTQLLMAFNQGLAVTERLRGRCARAANRRWLHQRIIDETAWNSPATRSPAVSEAAILALSTKGWRWSQSSGSSRCARTRPRKRSSVST